jgi:hypothetical protein
MDLTELSRSTYLLADGERPPAEARFSPGRPRIWRVVEETGQGTLLVESLFDESAGAALTRTVHAMPGESPGAGECGILVTRGDGALCFFNRRGPAWAGTSGPRILLAEGTDPGDGVWWGHWLARGASGWSTLRRTVPVWKLPTPLEQAGAASSYALVTQSDGGGPTLSAEIAEDTDPGNLLRFYFGIQMQVTVVLILEDFAAETLDWPGYGSLSSVPFPLTEAAHTVPAVEGFSIQLTGGGPYTRRLEFVASPIYGIALEVLLAEPPVEAPAGSWCEARYRFTNLWYGPVSGG